MANVSPSESFSPIVSGNSELGNYDYIGVMIYWTRYLLSSIQQFFGNFTDNIHKIFSNLIGDLKDLGINLGGSGSN